MHWFWRATIAVIAGCLLAGILDATNDSPLGNWQGDLQRSAAQLLLPLCPRPLAWALTAMVVWFLVPCAVAVGCFVFLTREHRHDAAHLESRCRRCRYILRGITEPRCPECGERI